MKKIIYTILACIIIAGVVITLTMGLKADIIYSKNVEIDIYIGKQVELKDIEALAKEVFPNERMKVQMIELFNDMVSITMKEKSDEDLKEPIEQLNAKINEKYEIENKVEENITIVHNPKAKLSSILRPYIAPIVISVIIILVYVTIRYKKLGMLSTIANYIIYPIAVEAIYFSILAITRFPINRLVIPIGLLLYVTTVTGLSLINERKLSHAVEKNKNK